MHTPSVGQNSAAESYTADSAPASIAGEYLSEAGDGEILQLHEDGTFLSYTVTDMSTTDGAVTMTETVTGTYAESASGTCALTISELTLQADGIEGDAEQIEAYVDLLAGEDEEMRALYTRLFGGEKISGEELYGEETFAILKQTGANVELDFKNSTFAYILEQE